MGRRNEVAIQDLQFQLPTDGVAVYSIFRRLFATVWPGNSVGVSHILLVSPPVRWKVDLVNTLPFLLASASA